MWVKIDPIIILSQLSYELAQLMFKRLSGSSQKACCRLAPRSDSGSTCMTCFACSKIAATWSVTVHFDVFEQTYHPGVRGWTVNLHDGAR